MMDKVNKLIDFLSRGNYPGQQQIKDVFDDIMSGRVGTGQLKEFLLALKDKENPEVIAGAAQAMRQAMIKIDVRSHPDEVVLDTCGTGGSSFATFNISTVTAFVLAGCGIKVAKHGNRAVSSSFGSADVLRELGLNLELSPRKVCEMIKDIGIGFLFAPLYHPAMKYAAEARRQLAQRTIFNILGPICNPAGADVQIVGVYEKRLTTILAEVLGNLGAKRAFVVYGPKGIDEVSIEGQTGVVELADKSSDSGPGRIRDHQISPSDFGIKEAPLSSISPGRDAHENAKIVLDILKGEQSSRTDAVLLNAGLGIVAVGKTNDFKQAKDLALESIVSGRALKKLMSLIERSK